MCFTTVSAIITTMKTRSRGFTVIELLFVVAFLGTIAILFFVQRNNVEIAAHDTQRKTAINAMYYSLEEVFYAKNSYYPLSINSEVLPSVDPDLFTDPNGVAINDSTSNYRYQGTNCTDNKCKSYTLRAILENEADYVKTSDHS
jgi:Tfp pilus assembly protein PilE